MQKLSQTQNYMKTKIQEALKNKYRNLGFSDKVFEGVADSIQTFIKEEAEIATFVDGAETMLKTFQSTADQLRTEKSLLEKEKSDLNEKLAAELAKNTPPINPPPINPPLKDDTTPEWAKALLESTSALAKKVTDMEQGEQAKKLLADAKALFINEDIHPDRKSLAELAFKTITSNISLETKIEDIVSNAKNHYNELCSTMAVEGYVPKNPDGGDVKPKSAAQAFVEEQKSNTVSKSKEISKRLGIEEKD